GRLGRRRGHAATLAAPVGTAASASGVLPRVKPMAPALSPSRASDFMQCPLLYRFRVVDRLPEPPNPAAARGPLVHAGLERFFDLPAAERTPEAAVDLLPTEWARLVQEAPELASLVRPDGPMPAEGAEAEGSASAGRESGTESAADTATVT